MEQHITEEDLIRLQFNLMEDDRIEQIQGHLALCDGCRKQQARVRGKFAKLDCLKDQPGLSEELVQSVLETCKKTTSMPSTWKTPIWGLSVAASIMLGAVIFYWVKAPASRQEGIGPDAKKQGVSALSAAKSKRSQNPSAVSQARLIPDKMAQADLIGNETPPFAPASAIELVVVPKRQDVQITVYNSADLTLVREERRIVLKRGWNWLQFMWANTHIDPTSLHLAPQAQADKIRIEQLVFPAGLKDIGRWLIHSEVEGFVPFEMSYFVSGISWRAFYMGTLSQDERTLSLQGYVRIENQSGEDFEDVRTRLVVGKVHLLDEILALSQRPQPFGRPVQAGFGMGGGMGMMHGYGDRLGDTREWLREGLQLMVEDDACLEPKAIAKQGLSEYFLYTIPGTETIPHQWSKRLLSFTVDDVNTTSLYRYDESRYGENPMRFIRFANDKVHNLGQSPIPGGDVKIYQEQTNERLSFVGSTDMKYIPVNEEVELNLGSARLVTVKPHQMAFETTNHEFDKDGNIAGWDDVRVWRIDIDNARSGPARCEILRDFAMPYWTLQMDDPGVIYERHDATRVRLRVTVPAQARRSLSYTVTRFNGTRTQVAKEAQEETVRMENSNMVLKSKAQ